MRISDWSSDVCSSDLSPEAGRKRAGLPGWRPNEVHECPNEDSMLQKCSNRKQNGHSWPFFAFFAPKGPVSGTDRPPGRPCRIAMLRSRLPSSEIGRASGREGGGKYV